MRAGSLAGGIILFLVGGFLLVAGANDYSEGQSLGGQFYQAFGGTNYSAIGSTLLVIGAIIALIGLVLIARGFGTSHPSMPSPAPVYRPPQVASAAPAPVQASQDPSQATPGDSKFCMTCGNKMPRAAAFCSKCGASQN
jgi:hypothetical protein